MTATRFKKGVLALVAGCLINYLGDHLLGVRIELFWGLSTFSLLWFLDVFIVPFVAGIAVGTIFGLGGKWLCYFPPLIVRFYGYFETMKIIGVPDGAALMPMGWWGFFVILAVESAAIGGVIGEIMIKRTYGRKPTHLEYEERAAKAREKSQTDA
jgi:xanthosine utilization system XapX-like protein